MKEFIKYIKDNEWTWVFVFITVIICGTLTIFNICSIPSNIDRAREADASRQERLYTAKHSLVDSIYSTATLVCRDYTGENDTTGCVDKVITRIETSIEKIK